MCPSGRRLKSDAVQKFNIHPIKPRNDCKGRSALKDAAMMHARMPFVGLELASLHVFPGMIGEGEELMNNALEKMGAYGPMVNVFAVPLCDLEGVCDLKARDAFREFLKRVDCRMGVGCMKHGEQCPGSGIAKLEEGLRSLTMDTKT